MDQLNFEELRYANLERLPQFKNAKGEPAHSQPDGSDWTIAEWTNAVCGEAGEAANIAKKIRRGDYQTWEEARELLAQELADIVTYVDITAAQLGIDLGKAVRDKFNKVSRRVKCDVYL